MRLQQLLGYCGTMRGAYALLTLVVSTTFTASSHAQSLTWLGTLGGSGSSARSVSNNAVVVGDSTLATGQTRAFRWQNGVMQDLGTLGGNFSVAYGVSEDGDVVVGYARTFQEQNRAFRWTTSSGVMQDLGVLSGQSFSEGYNLSGNGEVVVGRSGAFGFRWTASSGMENIGRLQNDVTEAHDVSRDGSVIVGMSYVSGYQRAFRWQNGTMQNLGTLPGDLHSWAYGVSPDGNVVVGFSYVSSPNFRAFRWTNSTGIQPLPTPAGYSGIIAKSASENGEVIVGYGYLNNLVRALRWTQQGVEDLNIAYANLLTPNSILHLAVDVSPNGRYIIGWGYNAATRRFEAFLLDTQPNCVSHNGDVDSNGCVDDADLLQVLFAFGQSGMAGNRVDVDCNGIVDDADLLLLLFNFGTGC